MKIEHKRTYRYYPELSVKLGQAASGRVLFQEERFDAAGNKIHEIIYSSQGKPEQENRFEYSGDGHLIAQHFHFIHEDLREETRWHYDEGKVIAKTVRFGFGEDDAYEYRYNGEGQIIAITRSSDNGLAEDFSYDGGRLIRHRIYDEDANLQSDLHYTYDEKGRKTEERKIDLLSGESNRTCFIHSDKPEPDQEIYNEHSILTDRLSREYEGNRLFKITHEIFIPEREIIRTEFSYSADGKQEESLIFDEAGQLHVQTKTEYGDHGFPTAEHRTENNPNFGTVSISTHFEYTFFEYPNEK